jgi:hypothetical protein
MEPTRAFMAIWYAAYGTRQPAPNINTPEEWRRLNLGVLRSWRYHHPRDLLVFLDIDNQMSLPDERFVYEDLGIVDGRTLYPRSELASWPRTLISKALALQASPFDQTCLFDLDLLCTYSMDEVWDLTDRQVGVLSYPRYRKTANQICNGLWVVKDRKIWNPYFRALNVYAGTHPDRAHNDELPLDACMSTGEISVTKLPQIYGMDPTAFVDRRPHVGPWCDCSIPIAVDWDAHPSLWWQGLELIHAFHLSGVRRQALTSPAWVAYQEEMTERHLKRAP